MTGLCQRILTPLLAIALVAACHRGATHFAAPDAPTDVTAAAGNAAATVRWTPPANKSSAPVIDYVVTSTPSGLTATTADTSATVSGLTNGIRYTFTVRAQNAAGDSVESAPSNAVTPATIPGPPTSPVATARDKGARVVWTAPANTGGAIDSYTVTSSPEGHTATVTETSASITGLTNGTAYTFTVVATNGGGTSTPSVPSNSVTPLTATLPDPPTNVSATQGFFTGVMVLWTPPVNDGHSDITSYVATASPGNYSSTAMSGTNTIITGLPFGTYTFTVTATNAVGTSVPSAPSAPFLIASAPSTPTHLTVVEGNQQLAFTWDASVEHGTPVTEYVVRVASDLHMTTATSLTVTGLTNGTSYPIAVWAKSVVGQSGAVTLQSAVPGTVPDSPTGVTALAGDGEAFVNWQPGAFNGGAYLDSQTVTAHSSMAPLTSEGRPGLRFRGLTNGVSYTFTVHTANKHGDSIESAPSAAITPMAQVAASGQSTIVASPSSSFVGNLSTVKVTLRDAAGQPLFDMPVTVTTRGPNATLSATRGRTNQHGQFIVRVGATQATTAQVDVSAGSTTLSTMIPFAARPTCTSGVLGFSAPPVQIDKMAGGLGFGDFNGDGETDVVSSGYSENGFYVAYGHGTGFFDPPQELGGAGTSGGAFLAVADYNRDGVDDVIINRPGARMLDLYRGGLEGLPRLRTSLIVTAHEPNAMVSADFDRDGQPDVAVLSTSESMVDIYHLTEDLAHSSVTSYPVPGRVYQSIVSLVVGDWNGDQFPDLAFTGPSGTIGILLNLGDGTFMHSSVPAGTQEATALVSADINGDTRPDLVVGSEHLKLLVSNGDGTFAPATLISNSQCAFLAGADFNGDGTTDLACGVGPTLFFAGIPGGTFAPPASFLPTIGAAPIATDLNHDGLSDVVWASHGISLIFGDAVNGLLGAGLTPTLQDGRPAITADFNGDGADDVLVPYDFFGLNWKLLVGRGDGTLADPVRGTLSEVRGSVEAVAGDFDGDGFPDLAFGESGIVLGNGDGTFRSLLDLGTPTVPFYPEVAVDVNADGNLDLVEWGSVRLGHGDGTFADAIRFSSGGSSLGKTLADVNEDGHLDILLQVQTSNVTNLSVLLGRGDGTFDAPLPLLPFGGQTIWSGIATGDFNEDGHLDVIMFEGGTALALAAGVGDGTFGTPVAFGGVYITGHIASVADANGDGHLDLVTGSEDNLVVRLGKGDGTFRPENIYSGTFSSQGRWIPGDFNADGRPDFLGINRVMRLGACYPE